MAIQLVRPGRVLIRRAEPRRLDDAVPPSARTAGPLAEVVVRALLVGVGVGVILVAGHTEGLIGVATAGVLALGASLVSWQS